MTTTEPLRILRAAQLREQPPQRRWLIETLWGRTAAGVIGGAPKCFKTFLGIDMATSVASGTACLGHFSVHRPGPALVYLAEDELSTVRSRIESLCQRRGVDLNRLPLHVIAEPCLRLDREADQARLTAALQALRPHLLLLDPLIRLHRLDENSATEISGLLSFFRELQRRFQCAIALVHHTSKRRRSHPGQSLRGSSDLHAFGDSNAYLSRRGENLTLTVEHRAAPAPKPMVLEPVPAPGGGLHLELSGTQPEDQAPLPDRLLSVLREAAAPLPGRQIRGILRVNNERLWEALRSLERRGQIEKTPAGWCAKIPEQGSAEQLLLEQHMGECESRAG